MQSQTSTDQTSWFKGDILVDKGIIVQIAKEININEEVRIIDANDCLVMPGLINCHTHAGMTLLRSYADDMPLMDWLNNKIWPIEAKLSDEDIYWGTKLSILEMIKSGTTTFTDMYFGMERVAQAVVETGVRAVLSRGMIGFGPNGQQALENSASFIKDWNGVEGRIKCVLGPHAPYTCPPDYLEKVLALAYQQQVGIHIHIAETKTEIEDIAKLYGKTPVAHLNDLGLFEHHVIAAHCVHVTDEDLAILKQKNVGVAHNPESNMKLASGIAPVSKMLSMGIKVGLGTDGASSNNNLDMIEEMRSASFLQKVANYDPLALKAYDCVAMATRTGAEVLGLINEVGQLKEGLKADIIVVDLNKPHLTPRHDLVANLVYAANGSDVRDVIIQGKVIMEGRKILTFDEAQVLSEAESRIKKLVN